MSFNTSLSGLTAASQELNVTSNNIANANTAGFKESRAEFADVYATTAFGSSKTAVGSGVLMSRVAQQFRQGNLDFTSNTLDLAVSGKGLFAVSGSSAPGGAMEYTRAGTFGVDNQGRIVNSAGQFLKVFPVDPVTGIATGSSLPSTIAATVNQQSAQPKATTAINLAANFPADNVVAPPLNPAAFDPLIPATYSKTTSLTVYDSQGITHTAKLYFIKSNVTPNTWDARLFVDDTAVQFTDPATGALVPSASLAFDNNGGWVGSTPATLNATYNFGAGASVAPLNLTLNMSPANTQYNGPFSVSALAQDGYTTGTLSGLQIDNSGIIRANYTNGQSTSLGQIALVQFANEQGLRQVGNTNWSESIESGAPLAGYAGTQGLGLVQSGAVETSNVDLTAQLVKLITAQRNFQANAKAIETASTVTQTIINMR